MSKAFAGNYFVSGKSPQQLESVPVAHQEMEMVFRLKSPIGSWTCKQERQTGLQKRQPGTSSTKEGVEGLACGTLFLNTFLKLFNYSCNMLQHCLAAR